MCMAVRIALPIFLAGLGSSTAQAHPGHAREVLSAENPLHYVLQPEHALVTGIALASLMAVTLVVWLRAAAVRRQQRLQPIRVRR